DRNVITFARSPVIPKMTRTSAGCPPAAADSFGVRRVAMVVIECSSRRSGRNRDAGRALVREPGPCPVDDGLRAVLAGREQGEVHSAPCERGGLALDRLAAAQLDHRGAAADRGHRALVVVSERV